MAYLIPIKSIKSNYEKKKKYPPLQGSVIGYIIEVSVDMFLQIQTDMQTDMNFIEWN